MPKLFFVTHPEVVVAPDVPVPDWTLSEQGRRRAEIFGAWADLQGVTHIWSSAERKAQDTATILAARLNVPMSTHTDLHENDRSATGFLPLAQFEAAADAFFAEPDSSFRGWETARAAQTRVRAATQAITVQHTHGDLMIVAHGAVGTLLWCHLAGLPIDRQFDQPHQGCYWVADLPRLEPLGPWQSIADD